MEENKQALVRPGLTLFRHVASPAERQAKLELETFDATRTGLTVQAAACLSEPAKSHEVQTL